MHAYLDSDPNAADEATPQTLGPSDMGHRSGRSSPLPTANWELGTRGRAAHAPFSGTGTTMLAALNTGRNSIGIDIDPEYCRMALRRLDSESGPLFSQSAIEYRTAADLLAPAHVRAVADAPARGPGHSRRTRSGPYERRT